MGADRASQIPESGFFKVVRQELPPPQRTALIRKGNELFNQGKLELAKRIFITTHYSDGLMRIGAYCLGRGEHLEAFRMFWLARDQPSIDRMLENMAAIVKNWLEDERKQTFDKSRD